MLKQVYIAIFGIDMPIYTKNMKLGEYGYYPEGNPNLTLNFRERITKKAFDRILKKYLPEYTANPEIDKNSRYPDPKYNISSIGKMIKLENNELLYEPIVTNMGYICFKEATPEEDGTILYLRNGIVMPWKERYIKGNRIKH